MCHAAAPAKASKSELKTILRNHAEHLYAVPADKQQEIDSLIESVEAHNPTHDPKNCPDKLAGCWSLLYTSRSLPDEVRSGISPLKLFRLYTSIDIWQNGMLVSVEFTEDGKRAVDGALTMGSDFEWDSPCRMKLEVKGSAFSSDYLKQKLEGNDALMDVLAPAGGEVEITFEDDGLLVFRDKTDVFVYEHRITLVHA